MPYPCLAWTLGYGGKMLQAEQQLGPGWTLMRSGTPKCPEIQDWLATTLPEGGRVGIDPFIHTVSNLLTAQPADLCKISTYKMASKL